MLRVKKVAVGVLAAVCAAAAMGWVSSSAAAVGTAGLVGRGLVGAEYVAPVPNAFKEVETSNEAGVRAVREAELLYSGRAVQVRRLDEKRRWEVFVLAGRQLVRVWADFGGRLTDTPVVVRPASEELVEAVEDSSVSVRRAMVRFAPEDAVLGFARLVRDEDRCVIVLQFDSEFGVPLGAVVVDAESGAVVGEGGR